LPSKPNYKNAILGTLASQSFMLINFALALIITPFLLRHLNQEEYGYNAILNQFVGYLVILDFGMGASITRQIALVREDSPEFSANLNHIISTGFFFFSSIAILVLILGGIFYSHINSLFKVKPELMHTSQLYFLSVIALFALSFPLKSLENLFFARQMQLLASLIPFFAGLISTLASVVFVYYGFGLWSFTIANLFYLVVNISLILFSSYKYFPALKIRWSLFDRSQLKDFMTYGSRVFIISIAAMIIYQSNRVISGALISVAAVTAFSLTIRIPEISFRLVNQFARNVGPSLFRLSEEPDRLKRHLGSLYVFNTSVILCLTFLLLVLNKAFLILWVGPQYFVGYGIFLIQSIFLMIFSINQINAHYFNITGRMNEITWLAVFEAVLNISLTIFLAKKFGLIGIPAAALIAGSISFIGYLYIINKLKVFSGLSILFLPIVKGIAFFSLPSLVFFFLQEKGFIQINNWPKFGLLTLVSCCLAAIYLFISMDKELRENLFGRLMISLNKLK
jgi:O-antigen/teichoic acid export membrane protein